MTSEPVPVPVAEAIRTHWHGCWRFEDHHACAVAHIDRLRRALLEARDCVESWGAYAGDYFQEKHDLAGDLAAIDAVLTDGGVAPCSK